MKTLNLLIKLNILVVILVLLTSCTKTRIVVQSTATGQISRIHEPYNVTKVGDTIVLLSSLRGGSSFYGKYTGTLPSSSAVGGVRYVYITAIRIK